MTTTGTQDPIDNQADQSECDRSGATRLPRQTVANRSVRLASGWKRLALLLVAAMFVTLGAIGVILPGLPTTPFLLVASYCLVRSSPRLNAALLRSRFFGPLLRDWQERGGVRRKTKISATVIVIIAVGITSYSVRHLPLLSLLIGLLALVGLAVIWRLPVARTVPGNCSERSS